jgi:hypothetical protein
MLFPAQSIVIGLNIIAISKASSFLAEIFRWLSITFVISLSPFVSRGVYPVCHHKGKSWNRSLLDLLKGHVFNIFILVPTGNL